MTPAGRGRSFIRLAIAIAILLALSGCSYGPPTWHHRVMNAMAQPREHRFAVVVLSTLSRAPRGLTAFPDGGKALILRQTAKLWLFAGRTTRALEESEIEELRKMFGARW